MLRFKQFIETFLLEAKIEHFSHIPGFDPSDPEHQDMFNAWNRASYRPKDLKQISTLEQLRDKVSEGGHLDAIKGAKKANEFHESLVRQGRIVLHHSEPGLKIYQIKSGQGGEGTSCHSIAGGAIWCTAHDDPSQAAKMVKHYDPTGEHTFVIHLDNEPNKNMRRIYTSVKGFEAPKTGQGGNFQDKSNVYIPDDEWSRIKDKYNLDRFTHVLGGVRGIKFDPEEILRNPNSIDARLGDVTKHGNEEQKEKAKGILLNRSIQRINSGTGNVNDISRLDPSSLESLKPKIKDKYEELLGKGKVSAGYIKKMKEIGFHEPEHDSMIEPNFIKKINNNEHDFDDLTYLKETGMLNQNMKNLLSENLTDKIKNNKHNVVDLAFGKAFGYLNDEHRNLLADEFSNKIRRGEHTDEDVYQAGQYAYLKDEHRKPLAVNLSNKIHRGEHTDDDIELAKRYGYYNDEVSNAFYHYTNKDDIERVNKLINDVNKGQYNINNIINNFTGEPDSFIRRFPELKNNLKKVLENKFEQFRHTGTDIDLTKRLFPDLLSDDVRKKNE